jgi:hypothetical protein
MPIALRRVSLHLTISVCTLAFAQLGCTLIAGETPAPTTAPTQLPTPVTASARITPPATTAEAPSLPDQPLSSSGPWYVFASDDALWALNADGSGLTSLWNIYGENLNVDELILWPAPLGGRVAIIQIDKRFEQTAPVLKLLELPSGEIQTIANLLPREVGGEEPEQVWAAVGLLNHLAWSSDGRLLAFNAAIDGPSADVYVYDTNTGKIARLTDGADQSTDLAWSPDDKYIVHGVARSLYYGYSGLGYDMLGAWAAQPDPAKPSVHLFDHAFLGYERILGWLNDSMYLGDSLDGESLGNCGSFNLRTVDIQDGEGPVLLTGHYSLRAFDPESGMMLLGLSSTLQDFDCGTSLEAGVYLFNIASQEARQLPDVLPDAIQSVTWSREAGLFFLGGGDELVTVDPTGGLARYPSPEDLWDTQPIVGPHGDIWALSSGSLPQRLDVGTRTGDLIEIDVRDAYDPFWSLDEEWLFFFDALNLYAAPAPHFEPAVEVGKMLSPRAPVLVYP